MLRRDIKEILARVTVAATGRLGATWKGGGVGQSRGLTSGYWVNGGLYSHSFCFMPHRDALCTVSPQTQPRRPPSLLVHLSDVTLLPFSYQSFMDCLARGPLTFTLAPK